MTPSTEEAAMDEQTTPPEMLKPSLSLLVKLGSIVVHAQELLSPDGHQFDRIALDALMSDAEVRQWMKEMDAAAMLPKKRKE
jgi:hypothetical protein